jgi:ribosomal protein S18 acetylase RimI-like enzyme
MAVNLGSVRVREAGLGDLDEASSLMRDAYLDYFPEVPPPSPSAAAYLEEIGDVWARLDHSELLVAEQDGGLLGAVTFFPDGTKAEAEGWPEGWSGIRLLAVRHEARGRGIGRLLTEACLERARERGSTAVGLHTTEHMAVAMAMYERMGFRRVPEFDFEPGPKIHVIAYRLDL